jgi:signal transduction histidine kinase
VLPPLQRRARDAGMELSLDLPAELRSLRLVTDEDAVGQILFNLVDNAAKHARSAEDRRIALAVREGGGRLRLGVRDHGPGVPQEHRARIFVPFDRGAIPTASNDVPGVGLGLALARGLARDLGGELTLDAGVADGACFVLELPLGAR